MSLDYERAALAKSKSKGTTRFVLMVLAYHANPKGQCWPLIETLVSETNSSRTAVNRAIRELKELGEIDTVKRGHGRPAIYQILLPPLKNKSAVGGTLDENKQADSGTLDKSISAADGTLDKSKVPNTVHKRAADGTQNYKELPLKEELKTTTTSSSSSSSNFDIDFSDCITLYRNNIGNLSQLQIDDFGAVFDGLSPPPTETRYEWFQYAILEASSNGINNWKYVRAILENLDRAGSLAKHKEARNGQVSGTATGHRGPSEKEAGNGNKAGGGSNSGGSRVGTGQTPEMRAKLKAGFARH